MDDLLKRKVHNWLFLTCLGLAFAHSFYFYGSHGLIESLYSGGLAFLITFPLFMIKALGGGDIKIFTAFGVAVSTNTTLAVFLYSLFWGSILGILMIVSQKGFRSFSANLFSIVTFKKASAQHLHKMPFAFALFCGWISHLIISHYGRIL